MEIDFDLYLRMSHALVNQARNPHEYVLTQIVKATEELGEVASAFLIHTGCNPRKDSASVSQEDVCGEVTDTIGTLLVLLTVLSSDPEKDMELMQEKFELRLDESRKVK